MVYDPARPCATKACEPRQVRKEAAVSNTFWAPQVAWPVNFPPGEFTPIYDLPFTSFGGKLGKL